MATCIGSSVISQKAGHIHSHRDFFECGWKESGKKKRMLDLGAQFASFFVLGGRAYILCCLPTRGSDPSYRRKTLLYDTLTTLTTLTCRQTWESIIPWHPGIPNFDHDPEP
ncbi:hypothetical protein A9K55_003980 [Cordyceps militaris]|uniref:Uncharacterized protein n=1 Tax=Cordyceps militaris TaxID=73501 RepID=A0A2H4SN90_CORMI|nr:hypothetical protein A9K55_003980 [Cordyceps militaris]